MRVCAVCRATCARALCVGNLVHSVCCCWCVEHTGDRSDRSHGWKIFNLCTQTSRENNGSLYVAPTPHPRVNARAIGQNPQATCHLGHMRPAVVHLPLQRANTQVPPLR